MGLVLLVLMIGIPILEIALFIQAGELIGLWPTLAIVILTAVAGSALLRHQGFATAVRARQSLDAGQFPIAEVFDGFCILAGGLLLLTPGFFTDTIGFLLLIPPFRRMCRRWLGEYLVAKGRVQTWSDGPGGGSAPQPPTGGPTVIDAEYEDITDRKPETRNGEREERAPDEPSSNPWSDTSRRQNRRRDG